MLGIMGFLKGCMYLYCMVMYNIVGGLMWLNGMKEGVSLLIILLFYVIGMQYGMNVLIYMGFMVVMLLCWDCEVVGWLILCYKIMYWMNILIMVIDFLVSLQLVEFDLLSLVYIGGGGVVML